MKLLTSYSWCFIAFILIFVVVAPVAYAMGSRDAHREDDREITSLEMKVGYYEERITGLESIVKSKDDYIRAQVSRIFDLQDKYSRTKWALEHTWDYQLMCKLVQCEAGGEDDATQRKVASVIFNRIKHDKFPDTIMDVMVANNQFTPIGKGSAYETEYSPEVKSSVDNAILQDYADGALFFVDYDSLEFTEYYDNDLKELSRGTHGMRFYTLKEKKK